MSVRRLLPWLLCSALPAQLALADLPKLARERAERSRPILEKALDPFWPDLKFDYRANEEFLDKRIAEAAALGDSVVPMLLEKLQPVQANDATRNTAGNCRRVLERLDPASFVDALAELALGKHDIARPEALRLLGRANTPRAAQLLTDLLDRVDGEERRIVLRSLRQLKAPAAAAKAAPMLGSSDRNLRDEVLSYLAAARAGDVVDTVIQALSVEKDNRLLPQYIEYFAAAVHEHDGAARALLQIERDRLDWQDMRRLVEVLATVAPKEHDPTCRRLHDLLDQGETGNLAVQAATTLRTLGDKQGIVKLQRTLNDQLRKPQRKREPALYEQRANLSFAIDEFGDAAADYEKALEYSDGPAMTRRAYAGIIRCEARRRRWQSLIKQMKNANLTIGEIEAMASDDPALQDALQQDKVKTFLQGLAKETAPK